MARRKFILAVHGNEISLPFGSAVNKRVKSGGITIRGITDDPDEAKYFQDWSVVNLSIPLSEIRQDPYIGPYRAKKIGEIATKREPERKEKLAKELRENVVFEHRLQWAIEKTIREEPEALVGEYIPIPRVRTRFVNELNYPKEVFDQNFVSSYQKGTIRQVGYGSLGYESRDCVPFREASSQEAYICYMRVPREIIDKQKKK